MGMLTAKKFIESCGLNWTVDKVSLVPEGVDVDTGVFAIIRQNDGKVLGKSGKRYCPLQNTEVFSFIDEWVQKGVFKFNVAGTMNGDSIVYCQLFYDIPQPFCGFGYDKIVTLITGHDGNTPVKAVIHVDFHQPLVYAIPLSENMGGLVLRRHYYNSRLVDFGKYVDLIDHYFSVFHDNIDELSTQKVQDVDEAVFKVIGDRRDLNEICLCIKQNMISLNQKCIDEVSGSLFVLYLAFMKWVDEQWCSSRDNLRDRILGKGALLKTRLLDMFLSM